MEKYSVFSLSSGSNGRFSLSISQLFLLVTRLTVSVREVCLIYQVFALKNGENLYWEPIKWSVKQTCATAGHEWLQKEWKQSSVGIQKILQFWLDVICPNLAGSDLIPSFIFSDLYFLHLPSLSLFLCHALHLFDLDFSSCLSHFLPPHMIIMLLFLFFFSHGVWAYTCFMSVVMTGLFLVVEINLWFNGHPQDQKREKPAWVGTATPLSCQ